MRTAATVLFILVGALFAVLALIAPLLTVAGESLHGFDVAALTVSPRVWGLLARGFWIAGCAAVLATVLGAAIAPALASSRHGRLASLAIWACLVVFLTPPYVYAFAWSFPVLPGGVLTIQSLNSPLAGWLATSGRAVLCLALWASPIAAVLLAAGWRTVGQSAATLSCLDGGLLRVLPRAVAPAMAAWIAAALLAVLMMTLTEFSICHLCTVATWNTEILAEVQLIATPGRAFVLAWPLLALLIVIAAPLLVMRRRIAAALAELASLPADAELTESRIARSRRSAAAARLGLALALLALLSGPLLLITNWRDPAAATNFTRTFPHEWRWAAAIGCATALSSSAIAIMVDVLLASRARRLRVLGAAAAILAAGWAFAPPVLVGDAFKAAYQNMPWISDTVAVVVLTETARFAVIPIAMTALAARVRAGEFGKVALADGADARQAFVRVRLPLGLPSLLAGGVLAGVLGLGEVAASSMVAPPGVNSLAVTLLNQIHFGRDDQVIALCLSVYAALGVVVAVLMAAARRGLRISA